MSHVEQELLTLPSEHTSAPPVFSVVFVARSYSLLCHVFVNLAIVLSVLLRFTASDHHFGIFKLLFLNPSLESFLNTLNGDLEAVLRDSRLPSSIGEP